MVPEEKRLKEDFEWLLKNTVTLQQKNCGKFIAIVNKQVAGIGKSAKEAYDKSKASFPNNEPLLDLVPSKDFLLL